MTAMTRRKFRRLIRKHKHAVLKRLRDNNGELPFNALFPNQDQLDLKAFIELQADRKLDSYYKDGIQYIKLINQIRL